MQTSTTLSGLVGRILAARAPVVLPVSPRRLGAALRTMGIGSLLLLPLSACHSDPEVKEHASVNESWDAHQASSQLFTGTFTRPDGDAVARITLRQIGDRISGIVEQRGRSYRVSGTVFGSEARGTLRSSSGMESPFQAYADARELTWGLVKEPRTGETTPFLTYVREGASPFGTAPSGSTASGSGNTGSDGRRAP